MIPAWANYVARNEDGELRVFKNRPHKTENGFWLWQENNMTDYGATIYEMDDGFEDIVWGDSKPVRVKQDNPVTDSDPIKPEHYRKGEIDLYESWYRTYPFNEFRAGMQMIAERYMKRDKNDRVEDLSKGIYTLERLKEYENLAKGNNND